MNSNIVYRTDELARYFATHRVTWDQFYESERVIISRLALNASRSVLDVGCGCGGLGLALREKFGVTDYTGVEINSAAAAAGRRMNGAARILQGDILDLSRGELRDWAFNVVFSLSCVDWNVRFNEMLLAVWQHVAPGGHLVATFRLTDGPSCNDMARSYQYINFEGVRAGEKAAYVVLNAGELMEALLGFDPAGIAAFGYWGPPSASAMTPYERLCFCAVAIRKRATESDGTRLDLELPEEIRSIMRTR
ncbi:MAG: methyltransferase domain-containing protein [Proteobacteria bacterium]|nr:methyltransferase domain-containing protein [Pseudomonadota bacterium]